MKHIERIKQTDYDPPEVRSTEVKLRIGIDRNWSELIGIVQDDILWARKRTEQITEAAIDINKVPFNFIDVGGQRSQVMTHFNAMTH